jgi:hypothetical protein
MDFENKILFANLASYNRKIDDTFCYPESISNQTKEGISQNFIPNP